MKEYQVDNVGSQPMVWPVDLGYIREIVLANPEKHRAGYHMYYVTSGLSLRDNLIPCKAERQE